MPFNIPDYEPDFVEPLAIGYIERMRDRNVPQLDGSISGLRQFVERELDASRLWNSITGTLGVEERVVHVGSTELLFEPLRLPSEHVGTDLILELNEETYAEPHHTLQLNQDTYAANAIGSIGMERTRYGVYPSLTVYDADPMPDILPREAALLRMDRRELSEVYGIAQGLPNALRLARLLLDDGSDTPDHAAAVELWNGQTAFVNLLMRAAVVVDVAPPERLADDAYLDNY